MHKLWSIMQKTRVQLHLQQYFEDTTCFISKLLKTIDTEDKISFSATIKLRYKHLIIGI